MVLSQKEVTLLQDIKAQEQLCVEKYSMYSNEAKDPALKSLFGQIEKTERQHLDTVSKILNGNVPDLSAETSSLNRQSTAVQEGNYSALSDGDDKKHDKFLCSDCLGTEKHVSNVYNTSIFEFKDAQIRDDLNHIQKEEQEHGKLLYDYMSKNGMYN